MRIFAALVLITSGMFLSADASAEHRDCRRGVDHPHPSCGYSNYRSHSHRHGYRHYDYRNYHHHNRSHGHRRSDNDDWAWAAGGFILGAIIANNANENRTQAQSNSVPLPPPQQRKVVTCSDEVAYDENNQPYVKRQCYESWR